MVLLVEFVKTIEVELASAILRIGVSCTKVSCSIKLAVIVHPVLSHVLKLAIRVIEVLTINKFE